MICKKRSDTAKPGIEAVNVNNLELHSITFQMAMQHTIEEPSAGEKGG